MEPGLFPLMLERLLHLRAAAKHALKDQDGKLTAVQRLALDARQRALKLCANASYGFTGTTKSLVPAFAQHSPFYYTCYCLSYYDFTAPSSSALLTCECCYHYVRLPCAGASTSPVQSVAVAEAVLLHGAAMCKRAVALATSPEIAAVCVDVTTGVWYCYYSVVVVLLALGAATTL